MNMPAGTGLDAHAINSPASHTLLRSAQAQVINSCRWELRAGGSPPNLLLIRGLAVARSAG